MRSLEFAHEHFSGCGGVDEAAAEHVSVADPVLLDALAAAMVLDSTTETIGRIAASNGIVIYEIAAERFDLEEMFLDLTTSKGAVR